MITIENVSATTGGDGAYILQNIPKGSRTIIATKIDYDESKHIFNAGTIMDIKNIPTGTSIKCIKIAKGTTARNHARKSALTRGYKLSQKLRKQVENIFAEALDTCAENAGMHESKYLRLHL